MKRVRVVKKRRMKMKIRRKILFIYQSIAVRAAHESQNAITQRPSQKECVAHLFASGSFAVQAVAT